MRINANKLLVGVLVVIAVFVVSYFAKRYSQNRDDAKLSEVRRLYSQFTLPSDFAQTNVDYISKLGLAQETKYFSAKSDYQSVKSLLERQLTGTGWTLVQERQMSDWGRDLGGRQLRFRKADYFIVVEYAGEKADAGWDYAVTVKWESL